MALAALVFGSSHDRARSRWCVWFFDAERRELVPLAEYREKAKSDGVAWELAAAAGSLSDATVSGRILNTKGPEVAVLAPELSQRLIAVATAALTGWQSEGEPERAAARKTEDDNVYVVRLPGQR